MYVCMYVCVYIVSIQPMGIGREVSRCSGAHGRWSPVVVGGGGVPPKARNSLRHQPSSTAASRAVERRQPSQQDEASSDKFLVLLQRQRRGCGGGRANTPQRWCWIAGTARGAVQSLELCIDRAPPRASVASLPTVARLPWKTWNLPASNLNLHPRRRHCTWQRQATVH
jgi:hypothetical protein